MDGPINSLFSCPFKKGNTVDIAPKISIRYTYKSLFILIKMWLRNESIKYFKHKKKIDTEPVVIASLPINGILIGKKIKIKVKYSILR